MSLGEFDIIRRYFTRSGTRPGDRADVLLGIGDDAAVLEVPADRRLVLAVDTIIEDVHFPGGTAAPDIGYRALAVNLSDLAAMGAEPAWMTLSLSLPQADEAWLEGFAGGLFELADRHSVALVGGDTVRGPLVVTIQLAGWVETDRWLTRSGAKPGDALYVSGIPGEAAAGLAAIRESLSGAAAARLRQRFLRPEPRVGLGRVLRSVASAALDVSDGLLTDLEKLCTASRCGADVELELLPASPAMHELFEPQACLQYALAGGDDYELLFTVAPEREQELLGRLGLVSCTRIGRMREGVGASCLQGGRKLDPGAFGLGGYDHFRA